MPQSSAPQLRKLHQTLHQMDAQAVVYRACASKHKTPYRCQAGRQITESVNTMHVKNRRGYTEDHTLTRTPVVTVTLSDTAERVRF